jgi:hypothetical protein
METSGFLHQGGSVGAESLFTASSNIWDFSSTLLGDMNQAE